MSRSHWNDLESWFQKALARPESERSSFLEAHCKDPALRGQVEELLRSDADAAPFLATPTRPESAPAAFPMPSDPNSTTDSSVSSSAPTSVPTWIGPYRILDHISEGGMGSVYLAEQREPVRRRVALKVIKHGMDTREVLRRFEVERQALALMNHPNIARVFDAGSTDAGRPYFTMEHCPGLPIAEYCDRNELDVRTRLELFVQVCDGIHHAHQKG
ncbi:MAG: protein kinase, partial [Planctomycetota bacterium]